MGASYARVIAVVQRVIRDVVLANVMPNLLGRPVRDRVDLHELELRVPLHFAGRGSCGGLIPADCCDPRPQLGEFLFKRFYFSEAAALVGIAGPKRSPMLTLLLLRRQA